MKEECGALFGVSVIGPGVTGRVFATVADAGTGSLPAVTEAQDFFFWLRRFVLGCGLPNYGGVDEGGVVKAQRDGFLLEIAP